MAKHSRGRCAQARRKGGIEHGQPDQYQPESAPSPAHDEAYVPNTPQIWKIQHKSKYVDSPLAACLCKNDSNSVAGTRGVSIVKGSGASTSQSQHGRMVFRIDNQEYDIVNVRM